jgi:hypothetical protein
MKKIALGVLLSLMVMLTACSNDPLKKFEKAVEKTGNMEQFKMSLSGDIKMSSPEVEGQEPLGDMGNMTINLESQVDKDKTKVDMKYTMMGITMDMVMYGDAEQSIMKMPMMDKYLTMPVNTEGSMDVEQSKESLKKLSNEIYGEMIEKIKEDGEISLEKTELELPDGKVEVDKGVVKLQSKAIKELLISVAEKAYTDETLMGLVEDETGEAVTKEQREAELAEMKAELEKVEIEGFEFAVYIDKNDYIVGQDIKMNIVNAESNEESLGLDLKARTWDIGNAQNIEFPELTEENSMSFEEYMKSFEIQMPEGMEGEDFNMEDFNMEGIDLENIEVPEITVE